MNIIIMGAGAIGSLFGALLAKKNTVVLVGHKPYITAIQHNGLNITGKTRLHVKLPAVVSVKDVSISADLIILTVKAFDTEIAIKQIEPIIREQTVVLSLQNGLDNIEKIQRIINKNQILAGVTTYSAFIAHSGTIMYTGRGKNIIGHINDLDSKRLKDIVYLFKEVGIETQKSNNIKKEIWKKAIINSSINPLTAFFNCKNGYLLENPLLDKIVEMICKESTLIAQAEGISLTINDMIQQTKEVIKDTANNYSSMLQSIIQGKNTEINSINGKLITVGDKHKIDTSLNKILVELITSLSNR